MRLAARIHRAIHPADLADSFGWHLIFDGTGLGETLRMTIEVDLQPVTIGVAGIAVAGQLMRQIDHET